MVYISGLPHGFYEEALENFLSQYGRVKRVYVPRSTKSGKAKGYAFVQFAKLRNAEQVHVCPYASLDPNLSLYLMVATNQTENSGLETLVLP